MLHSRLQLQLQVIRGCIRGEMFQKNWTLWMLFDTKKQSFLVTFHNMYTVPIGGCREIMRPHVFQQLCGRSIWQR